MDRERLERMVETIDGFEEQFYNSVIALHQDSRVRRLTEYAFDNRFPILVGSSSTDRQLFYTKEGFMGKISGYEMPESRERAAEFNHREFKFEVVEGKLAYGRNTNNRRTMLQLFPGITYQAIEQSLAEGIAQLPIYEATQERTSEQVNRIFDEVRSATDKP